MEAVKVKVKNIFVYFKEYVINRKKTLVIFCVLILGAFITATIDQFMGVNFVLKDISAIVQVSHKVVHMLWGGIIVAINKELR